MMPWGLVAGAAYLDIVQAAEASLANGGDALLAVQCPLQPACTPFALVHVHRR